MTWRQTPSTRAPMSGRTRQFGPSRSRLACQLGSMTGFASGYSRTGILRTGWTISALTDIAAAGHRLPAVSSHRNLIASVLRSMDTAFGFEQWQDLRTPDLFEVELDAGRPIRFVRLDALRRFAGQ